MSSQTSIFFLLIAVTGFLFLGDGTTRPISILTPFPSDSISYDQGTLLIISASKEVGAKIRLSTQWEIERVFDLSTPEAKENFPKEFFKTFDPSKSIELLTYRYKYFRGYSAPETLTFSFGDSVGIRELWKRPAFADFIKKARLTEGSEMQFYARGWKDSTYSAEYDDPNNDGRTLYKLHVQLLPGQNTIYCTSVDRRTNGIQFVTNFRPDTKPTTDRATLFHNSTLEQSCNSCHEGLPSADSGRTMTADCGVCHKEKLAPRYVHAPVEMKECKSCHDWSVEKHAVVVEKSAPAVCYDCHSDKQAQVDSSKFQHPVAGDCLTCHSPHGTDKKHQLKADVFSLCIGCHEEKAINHPVGRHPVRFATLKSGEEISCISCHNPHGSEFEKLKKFPGGRMDICSQCH